ncbi:MAG TPA: FHA domain-containing protein [Thermoanaerobaculia bacterium]|nr:FHA domain-containing protein [Thermoanaerobaculia bacterium]
MPFLLTRVDEGESEPRRVAGTSLGIGRGTDAHLRFADEAVDLRHAVIGRDAQGFELLDLGSVSGTYLNGQPVEAARLAPGDRIGIGPFEISVEPGADPSTLGLTVRRLAPEAKPAAGVAALAAPKLDYAASYGLGRGGALSKAALSLGALGLATLAAVGVTAAALGGRSTLPRPGPVSSAHEAAGLAADCAACHAPFRGVVAALCEDCHAGPRHQAEQVGNPPCGGCHAEHRRLPELARVPDAVCTGCHGDLKLASGAAPKVARRLVTFDEHPDFRPKADPTVVRLNHALHLKPGLRDEAGRPEQLDCASCHAFDAEQGEILPLEFERHCQRCHNLAFDDRLPDREAPHGEAKEVVTGIFGIYAESSANLRGLTREQLRSRIFSSQQAVLSFDARLSRQTVTALDQVVRLKCSLCHGVELTSPLEPKVEPPAIPRKWLLGAKFSHGTHRLSPCGDCHEGAAASRASGDVLVPGITPCLDCHGVAAAGTGAAKAAGASACVTCHPYHEKTAQGGWEATLPPGRARRAVAR